MKNRHIEYLTWEEFEGWEPDEDYESRGHPVVLDTIVVHKFLATIRALCELSVQEVPCELCNGMGVIECEPDKHLPSNSQYQHPPFDIQFQGCPECGGSKKKYKTPAEVLMEIEDLRTIQNFGKETPNDPQMPTL